MYSQVRLEISPPTAWLYFNRPEKLNAMNTQMLMEAVEALSEAESRGDVHFLVLTGEGRAFSAGIDVAEVASSEGPEASGRIFEVLAGFFRKLVSLEKVTIAAFNGVAVGGGAEVLWAVDLSVAVRDARFIWAEARWGLVPPLLSVVGPQMLGPARAAEIAMTSGELSAEEAYRLGLVSRLSDSREKLADDVSALVRDVMANSPGAVESVRRMIRLSKLSALAELGISELVRNARSHSVIEAARRFARERAYPEYKWI